MFNCQECKKTSRPRTRMNKITVEKRERTYYSIIIKSKTIKNLRFLQYERKDFKEIDRLKKLGWDMIHESFSKGFEIVKEKSLCEECYKKHEK